MYECIWYKKKRKERQRYRKTEKKKEIKRQREKKDKKRFVSIFFLRILSSRRAYNSILISAYRSHRKRDTRSRCRQMRIESRYTCRNYFLMSSTFLISRSCSAICSRSATGLSGNPVLHMFRLFTGCYGDAGSPLSSPLSLSFSFTLTLFLYLSLSRFFYPRVQDVTLKNKCLKFLQPGVPSRSFRWRFTRLRRWWRRHVSIAKYWINPAPADFLNLSFCGTGVFAPPDLTQGEKTVRPDFSSRRPCSHPSPPPPPRKQ